MNKILLSAFVLFSLSGCLSSEAPKCSDEDVTNLVKDLYVQMLDNMKETPYTAMFVTALPKEMLSIDSIRPVAYDEGIKMRSCKATAKLEGDKEINIEYTIQTNEENSDEYYVELGSDFVEGLMMQNIMNLAK
ncbi:hypothetical protein KJ870_07610 [bacterium]|jgi:hypothetical protein|nr:hypothetical protein [bacterium]MBU1434787.1 hypothetical protein [bacterium]MBU1502775.1 hypothetical protein [bacterium]